MKWTSEKPKRPGYYWYIGPVLARDFRRIKKCEDVRDCAWGPIIAGVGISMKEIPSGDGNPHHERMWAEGRIVVEFYGSTVRRTLAEMPKEVLWAGPIKPPLYAWAEENKKLCSHRHRWDVGWVCSKCGVRRADWIEAAKSTGRKQRSRITLDTPVEMCNPAGER